MKAVVDVSGSSGAGSNLSGVQNGRVGRRRDVENEEIQMYLSKLKDLVPFMPKNKKLSKLEVIQYVIDYICDLQYALETHPSANGLNAAELAARLRGENGTSATTSPSGTPGGPQRQPLGVLAPSPNAIVSNVGSNAASGASGTESSTLRSKMIDPPPVRPYDIFLGYERWEKDEKTRSRQGACPPCCQVRPSPVTDRPPSSIHPRQCDPNMTLYIHLI